MAGFRFLLVDLGILKKLAGFSCSADSVFFFSQWFFRKNNLLQRTRLRKVHLTLGLLGGNFWLYIYVSIVSTLKTDCLITESEKYDQKRMAIQSMQM